MTTASTRPPLEIRRTLLSKLMAPHNHRTDRPRYKDAPCSGRAVIPTVENQGLSVLQLNAEGLTNAKLEVIRQLADSNQVAVVLLQEAHRTTDDNLKLPGFLLAGSIPSKHHGMATFVRTGRSTTHSRCPVTANAIASQLLNNGRFPDADRDFARWTSREVTSLSRAATADANLSSDFTVEELEAAIKKLKSGKAPGRDNIHACLSQAIQMDVC